MKEIHFHNWARNGDLHVSRTFVRRIAEHTKLPCFYHHRRDPKVLADLTLTHLGARDEWICHACHETDQALYINTWYGAGDNRYASKSGDDLITFDTLYRLFDDATQQYLGFPLTELGEPVDFLPDIDFSAYPVAAAREFLRARPPTKQVLFDTVECRSGQSLNFPLPPVLRNVALRRPDLTFYYTWPGTTPCAAMPPNAIWTRDVHGLKTGCDLNENAFISTFCDVVIGRNSSTYTFALLRPNLTERRMHFLEFSTLPFAMLSGPLFTERVETTYSVAQSAAATRNDATGAILAALGSL